MGVVYSPEQVGNGEIPAAGGDDQVAAASLLMNHIRSSVVTNMDVSAVIPGSTATGEATRRSDVDYLMVYRVDGVPDHRRTRQARFIGDTIRFASDTFNVHFEGQQYTDKSLASAGYGLHDAMWLSHVLDIQSRYPEWSHGDPLKDLAPYAIDFKTPDNPETTNLVAAIGLRYMSGKIALFSEAGDFNPNSRYDLAFFQRALEAPKAYTRKMLAMSALQGFEIINPDVTSRANMLAHSEAILDRIDRTGKLKTYHRTLVGIDAEYDHVLDEAADTGEAGEYTKWLEANYLVACALARQLAKGYRDHIEEITYSHPDISFWTYGIDVGSLYDNDFALFNSASEPLPGGIMEGGESEEITYEPISPPILYNMDSREIEAWLDEQLQTAA